MKRSYSYSSFLATHQFFKLIHSITRNTTGDTRYARYRSSSGISVLQINRELRPLHISSNFLQKLHF